VVTVETDAGITGIGEGGSKDMLEQCAGRLIGQDPQYIERLWQDMSRAFFYPPGREKSTRWARSIWRCGTSRARCWAARARAAGRHGAQLLRVLQHRRHHSRRASPA
jgi:L-alanine-DL-glutamate epimerase-like enolase superfamily enzyme